MPVANLKIKQYTYFALHSASLSCDEIEVQVGIVADEHKTFGEEEHSQDSSQQIIHSWQLICYDNIPVDKQIDSLVERLKPAQTALQKLAGTDDVVAVMQVVRYLDDDEGEDEIIETYNDPVHGELTKLSGQHQLLGWELEPQTIAFLAGINASLSVDEYN